MNKHFWKNYEEVFIAPKEPKEENKKGDAKVH